MGCIQNLKHGREEIYFSQLLCLENSNLEVF
jgi:hypothetical protein